jgi:hypothetical protein
MEDVHKGEVGSNHLFDHAINCGHSWCLRDSLVSCCHVVIRARFKICLNHRDTLRHERFCLVAVIQ